jgi:nudix-type nucleoside diphosphatase (YffH/AdpP family)
MKIDVIDVKYERFNGDFIQVEREIMERGDGVAVLLYEEESDSILFTRQFRIPTVERDAMEGISDAGWLLELPAGSFKIGYEEPRDAAIREVEEELGYHVNELQHISTFYVSPGSCTERIHLFYAQISTAQKLSNGGGLEEEHEDIQTVKLSVSEIDTLITNGTIRDAKTMIGWMWWKLHKQGL